MRYFEKFPKVGYDLSTSATSKPINVTNIMVRTGFRQNIFTDARLYYGYNLSEYDTPEFIANEYYNDPNRHWMVLQANKVVDPQYDWLLSTNAFNDYLISKYGSIEIAQTTIHHYSKTITKTDSATGFITIFNYIIDETSYNALPDYDLRVLTLQNGGEVRIEVTREIVYCYTYENEENEKKRNINLIDKVYTTTIEDEHEELLKV